MNFMPIPGRGHRTGNALIATLIIAATVGLALNLSSDRMQGLDTMMRMEDGRQQARLVAESIGTVLEGELRNRFDNNNNTFSRTIVDVNDQPGFALGYPGFAGQGNLSTPGLYFGKCLVRWRIEPVKALSKTLDSSSSNTSGIPYAINPNQDGENNALDSAYKDLVAGDPSLLSQNETNFTYRIVTDAYFVGETEQEIAGVKVKPWNLRPWDRFGRSYSRAQAVRVVQYNLVNLFEYTIFYAATGPIGDLEFWQGTGMAVKGRIHSNGAIYIGGGGQAHMTGSYHTAASGNGGLAIGSSSPTEQSSVTAVNGIYRMRKPSNYAAAARNRSFASREPRDIPTTGLTGEDNYNGDTPTDGRHTINGVRFTSANDSRSPDKLLGDFKKLVRDGDTGASVVTSLANAPQFGGLPFESQRLGSASQFLYVDRNLGVPASAADLEAELVKNPGQTLRVSMFIDHEDFSGRGTPIYYTDDPSTNPSPGFTIDPSACFDPSTPLRAQVPATNLPLWWQEPTRQMQPDVTRRNTDATMPQLPADGPFNSWEARGAILGVEMQPNANGRTALVIRERPLAAAQAALAAASITSIPAALPATPSDAVWLDHYNYLRAQYQVVFNQQDITDGFFGDLIRTVSLTNLPPRSSSADAIVTEDMFINRREANFMQMFFGESAVDFTGTTNLSMGVNHQYRVNVLTLNLRRIQDFIARMRLSDLGVPAWATDNRFMKELFSGVIYAHRTRRSDTYHPILRPSLLFLPNVTYSASNVTLTPQPAQAYLRPGETAGPPLSQFPHIFREGHGPIETFHAAVRVRGGLVSDGTNRELRSAVNWQHDVDNDGDYDKAPLGTSRLTIISPNPMYLWGDLNLIKYSDGSKEQRTPVAVFADGLTLLSAAWQDGVVASYNSGTTIPNATHTAYVSSFVINNIPCFDWNAAAEGTGAVANVCRFLENWGGGANPGGNWPDPLGMSRPGTYGGQVVYTFMGSLVVMGQQRYSRSVLGAGTTSLNNISFYSPPFRNLAYNSDLRLSDGKPPQAPNGVNPIRVVSTVNLFDY